VQTTSALRHRLKVFGACRSSMDRRRLAALPPPSPSASPTTNCSGLNSRGPDSVERPVDTTPASAASSEGAPAASHYVPPARIFSWLRNSVRARGSWLSFAGSEFLAPQADADHAGAHGELQHLELSRAGATGGAHGYASPRCTAGLHSPTPCASVSTGVTSWREDAPERLTWLSGGSSDG